MKELLIYQKAIVDVLWPLGTNVSSVNRIRFEDATDKSNPNGTIRALDSSCDLIDNTLEKHPSAVFGQITPDHEDVIKGIRLVYPTVRRYTFDFIEL